MRVKNKIAALLLTVLLVAAGFFMPQLTGAVQDRRQVERIDRHEADSVRLDSPGKANLLDKLRLAADDHTKVPLQKGMRLEAEGVEQQALQFAALLEKNGLLDAQDWSFSLETDSFLVISGADPSLSGIIWDCVLGGGAAELMVAIDDETGLVLAFQYLEYQSDTAAFATAGYKTTTVSEQITKRAARAAEMLAQYYGFSWTFADEKMMESDGVAYFALEFTDEQNGASLTLPLTLLDNHILFNG